MDLAPPPAPGSRVQELGDRLIVRFRPRRSWGQMAVLSVWLTGWTAFGLGALADLRGAESDDRVILLLWLFGWAAGECTVVAVIAWQLFGRELLTVTPEYLLVRKELSRFARTKRYAVSQVGKIEAARVPSDEEESRPRTDFCLQISYGEQTIHVGEGMGEREAEHVAAIVSSRIRPPERWSLDGDDREQRGSCGFGRPDDDGSSVATGGPYPEDAKQPSRPWRGVVALAAVVALVAAASAILPPGSDERPTSTSPASADAPSASPRPSSGPPSPHEFADPRSYAAAMTRYALAGARSDVLGEPECRRDANWTSWSCTVAARAENGPYAGLALTYRCTALSPGRRGGPERVTLCGPSDPPRLTAATTGPG